MTELCALDIIDNKIINDDIGVEIYTFGCPRWANKELVDYFHSLDNIVNNWRIVNINDPVAIVPGTFLGSYGFHHTAQQILYTDYSNLEYTECDGSGEDPECGYLLWDEDSDSHLWYLNVHENCDDEQDDSLVLPSSIGVNQTTITTQQSNEFQSIEEDMHFKMSFVHWILALILILIGIVVAVVCYILVKKFKNMNKDYDNNPIEQHYKRTKLRKQTNMEHMTHSLLEHGEDGNW